MLLTKILFSELPFSELELRVLLLTAPNRYKTYFIPKRTGGQREISQPSREIKLLQRCAVSNLVTKLPVHPSATAYMPGASILKHAELHAHNRYLLKLDFKDFFPSITAEDIDSLLVRNVPGLDREDRKLLCRLFTKTDRRGRLNLTIGAPSSPFLSNAMMYEFDALMATRAAAKGIVYSRYADDLALSTNQPNVLKEMVEVCTKLLSSVRFPRLHLNQKKTVFSSKKTRRFLTGLVLANDGVVSVGRDRKRIIRATVDKFRRGELSPDEIKKLAGTLSFIASVDSGYVARLSNTYGADVMSSLIGYKKL